MPLFLSKQLKVLYHQEKLFLCLISSFPLTESLLFPYAYVSIESIDCISSLITLYLTLLNICCVCNNSFFYEFFIIFVMLFILILLFSRWFVLFSSSAFSKQFLQVSNLSFLFMTHFFYAFFFFIFTTSSIK